MPNPAKERTVQEIAGKLSGAEVAVLADYQGLNVAEITELRNQFREANVEFKVYKNTLIRIAAHSLGIEGLDPYLTGPTALALSEDPSAPSKVIEKAHEQFPEITIKGGILGGKVIGPEAIEALVDMPSREQLLGMLANSLQSPIARLAGALHQAAPVGPMAGALQSMIRKLAGALHAVAEQQGSAA